ncbi:hypothetical protein [Arenibaculum sp.]|uniref:hypothetical protein n=1 Tax=Arenibaculum sp. TaxID=2865862 RepID=UPI002E111E33|nr:hypothetical protein [Arenibaculum sp.]
MIVYRDATREACPRAVVDDIVRGLRDGGSTDGPGGLLAEFGELEAAVADGLFPERDGLHPLADAMRAAGTALAREMRLAWHGASAGDRAGAGAEAAGLLLRLRAMALPARVTLKVAEGYAYYALYPETYLAAAERLARDGGVRRAVCVGIRSIGTSLSAAVAAGMEAEGAEVETVTVRPHGHPFDRGLRLTPDLEAWFRDRNDRYALVVDEGPGLSGSSFCGTARALSELGFPDERIVLFPSWRPDPSGFASEAARERWPRHPVAHASFEEVWLPRAPFAGARDLSGGAWRDVTGTRAAVQPWHERRKYLQDGVVHRFAGLGRHGRARLLRAQRLAAAGFGPEPLGIERGFLVLRWVEGTALRRGRAEDDLTRTAARYLAHLAREHPAGGAPDVDGLAHMIETNVAEGLGRPWLDRLAGMERHLRALRAVPAVAVDGRMLPHEWLRTPAGRLVKTDALDHHDDHFLPGPQDVAWDVAGLAVEFGLRPGQALALAAEVGEAAGDRGLAGRLPFQTVAYLAFRLGYADMAAGALGRGADAAGMARQARRYRRLLRLALGGTGLPAPG